MNNRQGRARPPRSRCTGPVVWFECEPCIEAIAPSEESEPETQEVLGQQETGDFRWRVFHEQPIPQRSEDLLCRTVCRALATNHILTWPVSRAANCCPRVPFCSVDSLHPHPFIITIPFLSLTASLICPCVYNRNPLPGSTETESSVKKRNGRRMRPETSAQRQTTALSRPRHVPPQALMPLTLYSESSMLIL
ncbi:hypothetical protein INR49_025631 [Caranx melampygus]|nr:hypothetical protein INR49_025631 [Caranx melampygus]